MGFFDRFRKNGNSVLQDSVTNKKPGLFSDLQQYIQSRYPGTQNHRLPEFGKGYGVNAAKSGPESVEGSRYHNGTENIAQYQEMQNHYAKNELKYEAIPHDQQPVETVNAQNIHGVDLFGDQNNMDRFWTQHGKKHEDYLELASHIPEVQKRLDAGESLSDISRDPKIGPCAIQYFDPSVMPRATRYKDTYEMCDGGRHRIMAAQEMGMNMPVRVTGEFTEAGADKTVSSKQDSRDIVFEGVADVNADYGQGGGKQFFIRDAWEMKNDGRLQVTGKEIVETKDGQAISGPKTEYLGDSNIRVHRDERELSKAETAQLEASTDFNNLTKTPEHENLESNQISEEELKQLDANTPDNDALTKAVDNEQNEDLSPQQIEDYKQPLSDQEDSKGSYHPDGWSNPRELEAGEEFYQVTAAGDSTKSSYFTDAATIDACRDETGKIDAEKLHQTLQVQPKEGVTEFEVTKYQYTPEKVQESSLQSEEGSQVSDNLSSSGKEDQGQDNPTSLGKEDQGQDNPTSLGKEGQSVDNQASTEGTGQENDSAKNANSKKANESEKTNEPEKSSEPEKGSEPGKSSDEISAQDNSGESGGYDYGGYGY